MGRLCPQAQTLDHGAHCPEPVLSHPRDPMADYKPVILQGPATRPWLGSLPPTRWCLSFPQGGGTPESATYLQQVAHL